MHVYIESAYGGMKCAKCNIRVCVKCLRVLQPDEDIYCHNCEVSK